MGKVLGSRLEVREVRKVREGWYCLGAVHRGYKFTKSRAVGIVIVKSL